MSGELGEQSLVHPAILANGKTGTETLIQGLLVPFLGSGIFCFPLQLQSGGTSPIQDIKWNLRTEACPAILAKPTLQLSTKKCTELKDPASHLAQRETRLVSNSVAMGSKPLSSNAMFH